MRTAVPALRRLIDTMANFYAFPVWGRFSPEELLEGMVLQESAGDPRAYRYEAHQDKSGRRDQARDPDMPDRADGTWEDDASYGLMQVMGWNIKLLCGVVDKNGVVLPVKLDYSFAYDPVEGLRLGCAWFSKTLTGAKGDPSIALARYNGGSAGNPDALGQLRTQGYVDAVARQALRAHNSRLAVGWRVVGAQPNGDAGAGG